MMLKGSKEALTVLVATHVTVLMSKGSKVVFVAYVHNIYTFNAMSKGLKGLKDYVMLKQGTNTFLLITFLIFKRFSVQQSFGKLRLRPFQPYHPMPCMFNIHYIVWYGWKGLSLSFSKLFSD